MRSIIAYLVPGLAVLAMAGCGGSEEDEPQRAQTTTTPSVLPAPGDPPESLTDPTLRVPKAVPRDGDDAPPADEVDVVRRWLRAVREGRYESAARLFSLPSKAQNGTAVLDLDTPVERLAFVSSLACGATLSDVQAADGYLIVAYELEDGPRQRCGGSAKGAIRVQDGKITEWYRLWEGDAQQPPVPEADGSDA